jgi:hypothetical protein
LPAAGRSDRIFLVNQPTRKSEESEMTINKGSFSEGFEEETGTWFGYMNGPGFTSTATSKISREDMLEKFVQEISEKLQKINKTLREIM